MDRRNLRVATRLGLVMIGASVLLLAGINVARMLSEPDAVTATDVMIHLAALVVAIIGIVLVVIALRASLLSEKSVQESAEQFRILVNGVTDYAIFKLDPRGYVESWNAGAERIKGYTAAEIVGKHFSRFYTEEDRNAGIPARALEIAQRDGKYEAEGWRVRKDGTRFWGSVVVDTLRDDSGRLIGFAKITRDATERLQHQQALIDAQAALAQSQKMEALGQLSGGIAHDFNNLLQVIKNGVELLQRRLQSVDHDVARYLEMIGRNVDRAASLTQRLLAFSRRQPLQPTPLNPNRLISEMTELLHSALGESVALETVLGSGTWAVSVDPNQLETALLNLGVNARDAMPQGGKLTIETSNAYLDETYAAAHQEVKAGQYAMIAVSDTGSGMTKEVAEKAFDPFFTTKQSGQGTGLGLSQVYGFIKQSGGHVKIYSEERAGTTVKLYLPRLTQGAPSAVREAEVVHEAPASGTILVVEDHDDVRAFTAELLRDLGYRVLVAPDARSALSLLEKEPIIDLLFTDVGLPDGINGRQLADTATARWPSLKVLFTTGYARNAIVHHGRLDPGVELILKPFTQAALAQKLRRVLATGRA
jgi:PAS domain S-box-containing protein